MAFFHSRKYVYFNAALLFLLVIVWCVSSTHIVVRSFREEPLLFYGTLSHASIPSLFGGTDIPFLDKTYFQINGDKEATFVLYATGEMNEILSEWFSFADVDAANVPLEIWASRVKDNLFVVQSISTSEGGLEWEELADYTVENLLVVAGIVLFSFIGMIVFIILGIKTKMPRARRLDHA